MCTIDKMLIKGIRSFSPDNKAVIQFYKPLTLIVGANGAGKTTIIECLKQTCTGELPPNTRSGQSFVHDPKVAHETEVKAQIKLRFFTANGQEITVLRVFQLTQKKTKLEFKTLDCTMSTPNAETGQKTAVTYRCADIDKMVPSLMGVSKAVLENVIFVHQEESNWPLAEGKVLKERFDDIFAATKYTKALESLRKLRLEKTQEIKTLKLQLDHLRTHRDTATRLQDEIERAQDEIHRHEEDSKRLEEQVQDKVLQLDSLSRSLDQLRHLNRDIQVANARLEELNKQAVAKRTQLQDAPEFTETTDEIRDMLTAFEQRVEQERIQVSRLQREVMERRQQLNSQNEMLRAASKRHSGLAAERAAYDAAVAERDSFVRDTTARLALHGVGSTAGLGGEGTLPDSTIRAFEQSLGQYVSQAEKALRDAKALSRTKDEEMSDRVDALTARMTAHQEQLRIKREQIRSNKANIESYQAQAESMVVNESMAADAQKRVEAAQDALRAKTEEQSKADLDAKLARERREIDDVDARIAELRLERDRLSSASETATRLRLKTQELSEKKEGMEATLRARRVKLLQLLGGGELPAIPQLRVRCEAALAAKRRELETQQDQLSKQQMAESSAKAQLEAARTALASAEAQRGQLLSQLRVKIQPSAQLPVVFEPNRAVENERLLEAALATKKAALDDCDRKLINQEMMSKYFKRIRQVMCEEHSCPACFRGFSTNDELESTLQRLDEDAQAYPAKAARLQSVVDTANKEHQALAALQPVWRRVVDIETREMRDLKDKIAPLEEALGAASASVQECTDVLAMIQVEVNDASQLVTEVVWQLDRQNREVATLQEEVTRLEAAVTASQGGAGAARSLSELDDSIEMCELEKRNKEASREMTLKRQNRLKEEILARTRELSEAREALNQSRQRIDRKAELQQKAEELRIANEGLESDITRQEREGAPLLDEREAAVTNRAQMRTLMQSEVDQHDSKLRNALQLQDSYNTKVAPIVAYEQRQGAAALARAAIAVEEAQNHVQRLTREIETREHESRERNQTLAEQETLRHQMQDVLDLRELQEQLQTQDRRIVELEAQQAQIGNEAALSTKLKAVEVERGGLKQKLDMLRGARQAQQQTVERAMSQLKAPEYRDITQQYNKKYAEVMYTEMANGDLDKYHKALERALLSFHTTKMADINKIIKELWQKTYRGQDIDYIQIKADSEGATTTSRSYNYRVVMYSGGAELDMRGRCSAGQKVLACLIIRLALAETFCLNCGILALDEPTTNLDAENAQSLAEALRAIMVARRDQENFQLIVITHDENFAHQIGTREQAEFLWRVTKDDAQHSFLAQERINDQ